MEIALQLLNLLLQHFRSVPNTADDSETPGVCDCCSQLRTGRDIHPSQEDGMIDFEQVSDWGTNSLYSVVWLVIPADMLLSALMILTRRRHFDSFPAWASLWRNRSKSSDQTREFWGIPRNHEVLSLSSRVCCTLAEGPCPNLGHMPRQVGCRRVFAEKGSQQVNFSYASWLL